MRLKDPASLSSEDKTLGSGMVVLWPLLEQGVGERGDTGAAWPSSVRSIGASFSKNPHLSPRLIQFRHAGRSSPHYEMHVRAGIQG